MRFQGWPVAKTPVSMATLTGSLRFSTAQVRTRDTAASLLSLIVFTAPPRSSKASFHWMTCSVVRREASVMPVVSSKSRK